MTATKAKAKKPAKAKAKAKKPAKGKDKHDGDQVCISMRPGFYEAFERDRSKIKDPRFPERKREIGRSPLIEAMYDAWVKAGRPVKVLLKSPWEKKS